MRDMLRRRGHAGRAAHLGLRVRGGTRGRFVRRQHQQQRRPPPAQRVRPGRAAAPRRYPPAEPGRAGRGRGGAGGEGEHGEGGLQRAGKRGGEREREVVVEKPAWAY